MATASVARLRASAWRPRAYSTRERNVSACGSRPTMPSARIVAVAAEASMWVRAS
ncbi:hypothetical protein [Nonomuraea sp. NPDC049684]|uniref:hypothetical protein n=1 Tax=Nonomuraea sp. NPDC049684 TaxID=3364356 RepID=UPI0037B771AF